VYFYSAKLGMHYNHGIV